MISATTRHCEHMNQCRCHNHRVGTRNAVLFDSVAVHTVGECLCSQSHCRDCHTAGTVPHCPSLVLWASVCVLSHTAGTVTLQGLTRSVPLWYCGPSVCVLSHTAGTVTLQGLSRSVPLWYVPPPCQRVYLVLTVTLRVPDCPAVSLSDASHHRVSVCIWFSQ